MKIIRLDHIAINVPRDAEGLAREFYGKKLGLQEIAIPKADRNFGKAIWYSLANTALHLRFVLPPLGDPGLSQIQGILSEYKQHFALAVDDIVKTREELVRNGIEIIERPALHDRERFMTADCFGNTIEWLQYHINSKK